MLANRKSAGTPVPSLEILFQDSSILLIASFFLALSSR